jgi:hypothetical protein
VVSPPPLSAPAASPPLDLQSRRVVVPTAAGGREKQGESCSASTTTLRLSAFTRSTAAAVAS